MRKNIIKLLLLAVTLSLLFGLVSCSAILDKLPFDIPWISNDDDDGDLEGLVLIKNKVAQFNLVYTNDVGAENVKRLGEFVDQLRALGVEIADPIVESDNSLVTDCEIIVGTGAKNRGDEFYVTQRSLGKDGRIIKIVDNRILIAGGTSAATLQLFETYVTREMKITSKTNSITSLAVDPEYSISMGTDYRIDSIKANGVELSDYTLVLDIAELGDFNTGYLTAEFKESLFDVSGCWLSEGTVSKLDTYEHAFVIRYTEDAGDKGFRIYCDGKNIVAECSYANALERALREFMNDKIIGTAKTEISFASDYKYEKDVTVASYKDFGAKGDGVTDDFAAILATHEYANAGGQKVCGSANATYYISPESFTQPIPVKTDVDFCGASVIIDDRGESAYANRLNAFFSFTSDSEVVTISVGDTDDDIANKALEFDGVKVSIPAGSTQLDWIVPYIDVTSMVLIRNKNHMDYIRYGGNENEGQYRHEVIIVNPDGSITEDTTVFFDYEKLTDITIYRCDDKPVTVENASFYTVCCKAVASQDSITKYRAYYRNLWISRANVTLKDLHHYMVDQPEVTSNKSDKNGSYPYGGFIRLSESYNTTVENCDLAGHATYYEKKAATGSSNSNGSYNYIAAGSYDISFADCTHANIINVKQKNLPYTMDEETHVIKKTKDADRLCNEANYWDIGNNYYWGVMCSNYVKNLKFDGCYISRIDAHEGFFNVEVSNTVIGHTFNVVGGGTLEVDNVTRVAGNYFIVTRGDYGGSFKGEMTIKNSKLLGYQEYNSGSWNSTQSLSTNVTYTDGYVIETGYYDHISETLYQNWNFGYDCYMPETITLIGSFESNIPSIYISNRSYDDYWEIAVPKILTSNPNYHGYELVKKIIYEDWDGELFPINKNAEANGTYANYSEANKTKGDYMASHCEIIEKRKDGN